MLFKTELLRTWYGLSDGEVEEQVNDRLSFSRFVGLGLEDVAPDSTTVCRFRNILVEADLYDMVLNEINRQLEQQCIIVRRGAIVDASISDSPRHPRGRKEYEIVEDRDEEAGKLKSEKAMLKEKLKPNVDGEARWIKKMGGSTLDTNVIQLQIKTDWFLQRRLLQLMRATSSIWKRP